MAEIILYKQLVDKSWMSVLVHDKAQAKNLLSQGYRQELPEQFQPVKTESTPVEKVKVAVDNSAEDGLKINCVEAKDLSSAVKGIGLIKAKKILAAAPFKSIDDLYAVAPSIDWSAIPINYESP